MQTHLNLNFHHHAEAIHQAAKRQLLLTLAAALALGALMLLPALAKAGDADPMIGANAPHQERNPSQHPELFTPAARGQQPQSPQDNVATATGEVRRPTSAARRAFIAANTVVVVTTAPAIRAGSPAQRFEELIGTNAPHQERNPSAHPELWSR